MNLDLRNIIICCLYKDKNTVKGANTLFQLLQEMKIHNIKLPEVDI